MDCRFTQAVKTSILEVEVCGRILKPICLRHRLVLEEIDSPAVKVSRIMSPQDLLLACHVLSTYDLKEMLVVKADKLDEKMFKHMFIDDDIYKREMDKFIAYLSYHDCAPTLWDKKNKGSTSRGIPSILACVSSLIKNGFSYEQAWTMPETEAVWYYVANSIASGSDIDVVGEEDKMAMEMLKNMEVPKKK
jgi:hypothetical protein